MEWILVVVGAYLLLCIVLIPIGLKTGVIKWRVSADGNRCPAKKDSARCSREKDHRGAHEAHAERASDDVVWSGGKQCQVCQGKDFVVVAEGGGGENVRCEKCGSLYTWSPFGLELIQAGQPSAKVVLPDGCGEPIICNSNQEAFDVAKAWNRTHDANPAAYVIDDGGVVATDARYPIR